MGRTSARGLATALLAATCGAAPLWAQAESTAAASPPATPVAYKSLGQPWIFKPYLAGSMTWNREGEERLGGVGVVGVYKDLVLPISGAFGLSAEGYVGGIGAGDTERAGWDGGARVFATSRLLFLNAGLDWNARTKETDFILAFTPYFSRGGLFGTGGNFRVEWIPGRDHSFNFGFQIPLEPHMGKTRAKHRNGLLPKPPSGAPPSREVPPDARPHLAKLRESGRWLVLHANFFDDDDDASFFKAMEKFRDDVGRARALFEAKDAEHPVGRSYATESRHYHEAFDAAFASVVGPEQARAVADRARDALLDEVLFPYDRLIGRFKKPDTLAGLSANGRLAFARSLDATGVEAAPRARALAVYDEVARVFERTREVLKEHLEGDERKLWMSLDLALRPEEHDSQVELDAVVARALGREFTRGNAIFPTNGSRFQLEVVRSLYAAREYHVLWIHDYAGRVGGRPDPVAHDVTVKGYLGALTRRVREYDETGRLPAFFLFQTQFFYEGSRSRLYLTLLEDPLGRELKLGKGQEKLEAEVRDAQEELRRAVASSKRLQEEARAHGGDGWVREVVKVHVSVTFPADLSFRSSRVVEFLPFAPDSITLDHRKLFFYDVTEDDPSRGQALFSGTGVGSEYGGPTWDDRGLLASGPAILQLKAEAGRLLRSQGFAVGDVPEPLRERPRPASYDALVTAREAAGFGARALNVHNEVGFGRKEATLAQAILYTLAPRDTIIVAPDSIWASPFWAGQLAGAALRGCHVYVVAPSLDNAPAAGAPILARTREVFARLLEVSRIMSAEISASGGHLRVGLYTRASASGDTLGKIKEAADGLRKHAFLQDEFPMPTNTAGLFDQVASELEAQGYKPQFIAKGTREGRPKMHRKTQLFVTREALRAYADVPEVVESLRQQLGARARVTASPTSVFEAESPLETPRPIIEGLRTQPPPGFEKAVFYYTVGSKNQDPRSAFLDGETAYVVAGPWSLVGYSDFILLMAATTWVDSEAELTKLIPVEEEKARRIGRLISKVL